MKVTLHAGAAATTTGSGFGASESAHLNYWEARAETGGGLVHAGSLHRVNDAWVPVCHAWHRLPPETTLPRARKALDVHLRTVCTQTRRAAW